MRTKQKMSAQLPPTPCTEEMRDKIIKIAAEEGKSIAEVQRTAISLFLASFDSNAINIESELDDSAELQRQAS